MVEMDNTRGRTLGEAMAREVCIPLEKTIANKIWGGPLGLQHLETDLGKLKPHPKTQFLGGKRWQLSLVRQRFLEPRTVYRK